MMLRLALGLLLASACSFDPSGPGIEPDGTPGEGDGGTLDGDVGIDGGLFRLIERNLLVRYFIDEAATGQGPLLLRDSAPNPLDLPVTYISPDPVFSDDGNRGLTWATNGGNSRVTIAVTGTKIEKLAGAQQATIEVVAQVTSCSTQNSRLAHIGRLNLSQFSLECGNGVLLVGWEMGTGDIAASIPFDVASQGRFVAHAVVDTRRVIDTERVRLYVDGVERTDSTPNVTPILNQGIVIPVAPDEFLGVGNREIGGRTIEGTIYYVAIYETALSATEVANNAARLTASDDQ